jgi:ABC-type transport system involved in multi-copper enzyme maturation permease subunit
MAGRYGVLIRRVLSLWWLTGPILEKELLVSSRQRRNYILRSVYVLVLLCFVVVTWVTSITAAKGSAVFRAAMMSAVATTVVMAIAWFQFVSLQVVSVVMLSDSISAEIRKKTLDTLVTTPITSVQIVMGKLCSKLPGLVILLAASMPVLAVVRGMGGVPWGFLTASLCVTVTAVIFAASVSLVLSTVRQQAYSVIVAALGVMFLLYAALPAAVRLCGYVGNRVWSEPVMRAVLAINPFAVFSELSALVMGGGATRNVPLPVHCGLMLGLSAILIAAAGWRTRRAALARDKRSVFRRLGSLAAKKGWVQRPKAQADAAGQWQPAIGTDAIVWRELRRPLGEFLPRRIQWVVLAMMVLAAYCTGGYFGWLGEKGFHSVFVGLTGLVILLRTATFAATTIAAERQNKAWAILLTTPLSEERIILSKAIAVLRRTLPLWVVLGAHIVVFIMAGVLSPLAIAGAAWSLVPPVFFLIGLGLFAGTLFRSNTGAIAATYAFPLTAWFFCPCFSFGNPVLMAGLSMQVEADALFGEMMGGLMFSLPFGAIMIGGPVIGYVIGGFVFGVWAKCRVRKTAF